MASTVVKRGKLYMDIFYKPELQKSFKLNLDLRSCISFRQARQVYEANKQAIMTEGKTPFLEYLNNYPFSYSNRSIEGPLGFCLQVLKMENLSIYEIQLKQAVLAKLKEYIKKSQKEKISEQLKKTEDEMLRKYSKEDFDFVHAFNYLHFNKEFADSRMLKHCIDALEHTDYVVSDENMMKVLPIFLQRLKLPYWNVLRHFDFILDYIVYKMRSIENRIQIEIINLENYAELQLHLIGYQKIPSYVDGVFDKICKYASSNQLESASLNTALSVFNYLPLNYNEPAFQLLKTKLIQAIRSDKSFFYGDRLPYNRMTPAQVKEIYQFVLGRDNIMGILLFIGNKQRPRQQIKKSNAINILYEVYCEKKQYSSKHFSMMIVACSILVEAFEHDTEKMKRLAQQLSDLFPFAFKFGQSKKIVQYLPLTSIFHLIALPAKLKLNHNFISLFETFLQREQQFAIPAFIDNTWQAVTLYSTSDNEHIIYCINTIITKILKKNQKFVSKYFTDFIFLLQSSQNHKKYSQTLQLLYDKLEKDDSPFFVQLYNRFEQKNVRMNQAVIGQVWKKEKSFRSIGKFMFNCQLRLFSSPRGYLIREFKVILDQIEPFLCIQDVKCFKMAEIASILMFCKEFYVSIQGFAKKLLLLTFNYIDSVDLNREGPKLTVKFIEAVAALGISSGQLIEICSPRIVKLIEKVKKVFPSEMILKVKELEILSAFGIEGDRDRTTLLVAQILDGLSSQNYGAKHFDVMIMLLKLHATEAIDLPKGTLNKLQNIIIEAVQQKTVRLHLLLSNAPLLLKYDVNVLNADRCSSLVKVLKKCLEASDKKQQYQYYQPFIQVAYKARNDQLLSMALDKVVDSELSPSQIIALFNLIKFIPSLSSNYFFDRIIPPISRFSHALNAHLTEILFILHLSRNTIPHSQVTLYTNLMKQSEQFLIHEMSERNIQNRKKPKRQLNAQWYPIQVLKALWAAIKTNSYSEKSFELYLYLLKNENEIKEILRSKFFEGLQYDYIYYIYPVFWLKFQKQLKQYPEIKQTKVFNGAIIKKRPNYLEKSGEKLTQKDKEHIENSFRELSLKKVEEKGVDSGSDNCYMTSIIRNDIFLSYWVKKNGKEYGFFITDDKFFNSSQEERGRVDFYKNALSIITGITILPIVPGKKIQLE